MTNKMTNIQPVFNKLGKLENPPPSDFPAAQVQISADLVNLGKMDEMTMNGMTDDG